MELVKNIRDVGLRANGSNLVRLCERAIEDGVLTEQLIGFILDEYQRLDSFAANTGRKASATQSDKAKKPRGKTEDGRTLGDIIKAASLAVEGGKPAEIWPHLRSEIENWAGMCAEKFGPDGEKYYRYPFGDGEKTITFKWFGERLRALKKNTI